MLSPLKLVAEVVLELAADADLSSSRERRIDFGTVGRDAYRTTCQTVIADSDLSDWEPGAVFSFRASPENPHSLVLG